MNRRKRFVLLFAFATALGMLEFGYHYLDVLSRRLHESPWVIGIEEFTGSYAFFLFVPVVLRVTRLFPIRRRGGLRGLAIHLATLVCGAFAMTSFMWGTRELLFLLFGLGHYDYGEMRVRYFMEFPMQALGYVVTVAIVTLYDRQIRAAQLEKTLARAQLQNLRLQLHPHFLFNTLNTISEVMYEDVRAADRMIARLSDLLRLSLQESTAQEVTLEREIQFLELYVETMKARFEERLNVSIEASADTRDALVPPLLLQPLVENSIRHGADPRSSAIDVCVSARRENGSLRLEIRDRGPGIRGSQAALTAGIGLSNTAERLQRLYGAAHPLHLENGGEGGLVVTVEVPFHVNSGAAG